MALFEIPSISLSSAIKASQDEISMMQEWTRAHGSSARKRNVHQETTIGKGWQAPRLPILKGNPGWRKKISLQSSSNAKTGETPHQDEDDEQHGNVEDEVKELDSSTDEESCASEAFVKEESDLGNLQVTRDVNSLVGTTSRFGSSVRLYS